MGDFFLILDVKLELLQKMLLIPHNSDADNNETVKIGYHLI